MKNFTLSIAAWFVTILMMAQPTATTLWKLDAVTEFPTIEGGTTANFIGTAHQCRGMAAGKIGDKTYVFLISRMGGNIVGVFDGATGKFIKKLDATGISGGLFAVNDAGMTEDGILLVCNMDNSKTGAFKVYRWDNLDSTPTVAVNWSYPEGARLGDKITVSGKISDGTARIYVSTPNSNKIDGKFPFFYFDMEEDNANPGTYTFVTTPKTLVTLDATGSVPSICMLPEGEFYIKANGINILKYSSDATKLGESDINIVSTGGTAIRYLGSDADYDFLTFFKYTGYECAQIIKVSKSDVSKGESMLLTESLGSAGNANGTGGIDVVNEDGKLMMYVLSTNNGVGKYQINDLLETSVAKVNGKEAIRLIQNGQQLEVVGCNPSSIEIFDLLGAKVNAVVGANAIAVNGMRGIHLVKIRENGKVQTVKVILK